MYVLKHCSGKFFLDQNLYLGAANLVENLDDANRMSQDKAEQLLSCMTDQSEWKIYRVFVGFRLAEESTRHIKRARKEQIKKELESIGDV